MIDILEGGNVFKDAEGSPLTQRITQADVAATVAWLERATGLDLTGDRDPSTGYPVRWLGSTGKKADSGDLDLAIDATEISKPVLKSQLERSVRSQGADPKDFVRLSGEAVHFRTPIAGDPKKGYVQTDFMFMPNLNWGAFMLTGGQDSEYKGMIRNVLMSSLAKSLGMKISAKGVTSRATDKVISQDPDQAAVYLLGPGHDRGDLKNVETIYQNLAKDPKRDQKLADFREFLAREGLKEPTVMQENETSFLARLRDRIINQGMQPIFERTLTESARIEHLEDLVFERGTRGIKEAMDIMRAAAENTAATTTVKWDGKPAIIWGRKPNGQFVLTDKSGFQARGYDGLATSPAMIAKIMQQRGGERGDLVALYEKLWPMLEAATPKGFRGYVQGDVLYSVTPPEVSGAYVFRPNFVEYKIPASSKLGQEIGSSEVGIAVHTAYDDPASQPRAIRDSGLKRVSGLLLIEPTVKDIKNITINRQMVQQLSQLTREQGRNIDTLFNPGELRAAGITDLPQLCKRYINSRIHTNYDNLLPDFGPWLQKNVTARKYRNIVEYLQSPRSNLDGISAAFTAFLLLHEIKTDMLSQLDRQQPGQEGWVLAGPAGRAKLVNRFGFSAGNRVLNNPNLVDQT